MCSLKNVDYESKRFDMLKEIHKAKVKYFWMAIILTIISLASIAINTMILSQ